jgi:hypothetical protein
MRYSHLRPVLLALASTLLLGCASASKSTTTYSTLDLTGDWVFFIQDPPAGSFAIDGLTGALAGHGQNITGIFRAGGTGCIPPSFDITFTGSEDAMGNLTLVSTNLPNNLATYTALIEPTSPSTIGSFGSFAISGIGPCAMTGISFRGNELANKSGTYAGSLSASPGPTAAFTITATEANANADGQFPITGTVTVTGTTCTNVFSYAGLVSGDLSATLTPVSGPAATGTLSANPIGTTAGPLPFAIQITSAGCNSGEFTGTLSPH